MPDETEYYFEDALVKDIPVFYIFSKKDILSYNCIT